MDPKHSKGRTRLGVDAESIAAAENALGVKFPDVLKEIWSISNGMDLPGGWILHPVYDASNPRRTCNSIVYENAPERRFDYMPEDLVMIAENGTGNHLVLRNEAGVLSPEVLVWDHERNKTRKWGRTLADVLSKARARVQAIEKAREKSVGRK